MVANIRIRNMATLGGNLAHGDYQSDPPTILAALDARVDLMCAGKLRQLALTDFQLGSYETSLQPGELLAAVVIPPLPMGMTGHYVKFTTGSSEERPCAGVAALAKVQDGVCHELRLAVGAVSAKPIRIAAAELATGKALTARAYRHHRRRCGTHHRSHRRCARAGGLQTSSGRRVDPPRAANSRQWSDGKKIMTIVGTNVEMVGGRAKVSGAVSYVADMEFPGQLYAKALRSPYPHAKLLRIDGSKAAVLRGVRAVVTRDDLAGLNAYFGTGVEDQPVLVIDKVRCVGDIVAAVAADSREIAEEAVTLIEADYQELPAVTDILEAAKADAPIIQELHVDKTAGGNIHGVYRASSGDIEQGFKESDEVIENIYKIPPVQHGHIEPHVVTALWEPSGKLVVHTPSQTPSPLQEQIAKVFKMPLNRVRVVVPFIGGGYGGKNHARIEPVVALLARKARRPVQWILTRDEVFFTGRRFGAVVKIKTGFKRDGRLVGAQSRRLVRHGRLRALRSGEYQERRHHRRRALQHSSS